MRRDYNAKIHDVAPVRYWERIIPFSNVLRSQPITNLAITYATIDILPMAMNAVRLLL
jgi:hypothetical protein